MRNVDGKKHYKYHQNLRNTKKKCSTLHDKIKKLIRASHLQRYVKTECPERSPPWRRSSDQRPRRDDRGYDNRHRSRSGSRSRDYPLRDYINTISKGFEGGRSSSFARKRRLKGLKTIHLVDKKHRSMSPITLTDEYFHAPDPDKDHPMVIMPEIAWHGVSKVLINQGSSVNILFRCRINSLWLDCMLVLFFHQNFVHVVWWTNAF